MSLTTPYNFLVHTFGCKVNTYDSGLLQKNLQNAGLNLVSKDPKIHILNTCAVTAEATKESVKAIRRIKAKSPFSTVVVTGCAAQVDTGSFSGLAGADLIVANSHKSQLPQILDQYFKGNVVDKVFKSNIFRNEELGEGGGQETQHTRSFLKIQDGCNSFCTFCIIPYARGKSRSISIKDLVKQVESIHQSGTQEVVLTGVHIGDYVDGNNRLEDLIEQVLLKTEIPRIRLTSLEPIEVSERLLGLYSNPRLLPHFHMSIQSASSSVLKDMKRKYDRDQVIHSLYRIQEKVPGAFVGMDVIAGFPTETEETFLETYQTLSKTPWTRLHVFPYSERQGTRAAAMEISVPREVRVLRAQRLRDLSLQRYNTELKKQIGQIKKVLVQKKPSKSCHGLSEDYWNVFIENENLPTNQEVQVKILGVYQDHTIAHKGLQESALRGILI